MSGFALDNNPNDPRQLNTADTADTNISIRRDFRSIIYNIISYLVGVHNLPIEYGDNMEIKVEMCNGNLNVVSVCCWINEKPKEGYIWRTEDCLKTLYGGSNNHVPTHYLKILNFMLDLLSPKLGTHEIIYQKYYLGRRLYVYGINDTTKKYYWYGDGGRIDLSDNESVDEFDEFVDNITDRPQ
jgi:hypothetical protein